MENGQEEMKEMVEALGKIQDKINDMAREMEEFDFDLYLPKSITDLTTGEKLTKKQRREKAIAKAKEKFPKLCKMLEDMGLAIEGLNETLKMKRDILEECEEKVAEIEQLQEDIKRDMDW